MAGVLEEQPAIWVIAFPNRKFAFITTELLFVTIGVEPGTRYRIITLAAILEDPEM